jgi:ribonuclease R
MLQFMTGMIDEEIDVYITGVERFGVFCQGVEIPADGLLPRDGLDDDHYDLDERAFCYMGRRSGRVLQLGGTLRVVVKTVDVARRTLEFALPRADSGGANRDRGSDRSSRGAPRSRQVAAGKKRHKSRSHKKKRRST